MKKLNIFLKRFFILSLIFAGLLSSGCDIIDERLLEIEPYEEIPIEENIDPIVLFCPEDNCEKNLLVLLNSSKKSIHCAIYDLKLEGVIDMFGKKSKDVDVKLILEKGNYDGEIKGVRLDENSNYMHNKFCIIDDYIVWTGSMNPTLRGVEQNNNNVVVLYSEYLSKNFEDEFSEMWGGVYKGGENVLYPSVFLNDMQIENLFCPEDDCADRLIELINEATDSVYFMTFSFTDEDVADALLFNDNIDIKGVFETTQAGSQYSQYQRLYDFGLSVVKDKNKATMHHKVFIIDKKIVFTGSYNPTGSGNLRNDENVIIIHDSEVALKFLEEFELVYGII